MKGARIGVPSSIPTALTPRWLRRASPLPEPFGAAEAIAAKDLNSLYISSSFFVDQEKYRAFCAYYAIMRVVDDRIDNLPPFSGRSAALKKRELEVVASWERVVQSSCSGISPTSSQFASCDFTEAEALCSALIASHQVFPIPVGLWTQFFTAMRADIVETAIDSWEDYLAYAGGAAVAPTTIYLLLIAARRDDNEGIAKIPKGFNVQECGHHLGVFAYTGHIIRDLAQDILNTPTRLCIAREDMLAHGVSLEILKSEAMGGRGSPTTQNLVGELFQRARWHLAKGRALVAPVRQSLDGDCQFILELIITMYEHVIMKIEACGCDPMTGRHFLTRHEQSEIVRRVAAHTGFQLPSKMSI